MHVTCMHSTCKLKECNVGLWFSSRSILGTPLTIGNMLDYGTHIHTFIYIHEYIFVQFGCKGKQVLISPIVTLISLA